MLHIVLLVLKILLVTVLILLGIAFLILLLVVFAPVRYKCYAEKHESFLCKLKVSWLGFVVCFKANYDQNGFIYRLKSFGGTLVTNEASGMVLEKTGDNIQDEEKNQKERKKKSKHLPGNSQIEEEIEFITDDSDLQVRKSGILKKIGKFLDRLVLKVRDRITGFVKKYKKLKDKTKQYKQFIWAPHTKRAWGVVKKNLIKLLKHAGPRKIKGFLIYGTGDPASTGQQLGYMSIALPLYYNKIEITPDFSQKILEGEVFIKGRLRVFNILIYACKVVFNKYVKRTIRHFKKISGGNE